MNSKHLKFLCSELQLGYPDEVVTRVHGSRGGSFMWRVNTSSGSYAIKQLAPAIDLTNEKIIAKYELSETIAYRFMQQGISAVPAIEKSGRRLFIIENAGYLVYRWVDGYTFSQDKISEYHSLKIAEIIAKLHSINLDVPDVKSPHVDMYSRDQIIEAIDRALSSKCPFAKSLKENQNLILSMNDDYLAVVPILLADTVVTHGDLNQPNVLWDKNDQPLLVDWESARKLNPTREIVRAGLTWALIGTESSSVSIYRQMLRTYIRSGGTLNQNHIHAAFYSSIGSMIYWMLYNIEIACNSEATEVRETAINQVNGAMLAMTQFETLASGLLKINIEPA